MGLEQNKLRQIANMDNQQFAEIIRTVVLAAGGSREQAEKVAGEAPLLKDKLRNASTEEINQIVNLVGQGKAEQILGKLKPNQP